MREVLEHLWANPTAQAYGVTHLDDPYIFKRVAYHFVGSSIRWLSGGLSGAGQRVGGTASRDRTPVVSPGREGKGILHLPTGQSGHPLSAHCRDQHVSWTQGRPSPFLAGPVQYHLTLKPVG